MEGVPAGRSDRTTLLAFGAPVVLVGSNLVAIRFSNRELAPLWGAGVRFGLAAVIFWAIVAARRLPFPRGAALAGAALYGLLGFAAFFAFAYWGLVRASAGLGQIVLALVPLLTMLLAAAQGLERFRWRAVGGAIVALAGIAIVFGSQARTDVPLVSLLSLVAAAISFAQTGIIVKRLPPADPVATNAVATTVGAAVFLLFLFLVRRWRASTVSYQFVLAPFVAVSLGSVLAGEPVTPVFAVGAALVLAGVYVGALANR